VNFNQAEYAEMEVKLNQPPKFLNMRQKEEKKKEE